MVMINPVEIVDDKRLYILNEVAEVFGDTWDNLSPIEVFGSSRVNYDWPPPRDPFKEESIIYDNFKPGVFDKQEGGSHYKKYSIQPTEFCQKNKLGFCEGNVVKYICRHRDKNGIEDLKKAIHYIEFIISMEYNR